ncbi:hypothetical protein C485_04790 [Natrinema altunense JCM 12890]|uniref:Uncharacterized protein n=1 Tax=Natrinema altunense (strain JCM 12890 / CGMCC 1.3731 / AJ2) TaxID=1227494 RepID=L9ZUL0_NATA2|nr:hypothetical protein C485_04790 [Natrinema altunense JCM 12890]
MTETPLGERVAVPWTAVSMRVPTELRKRPTDRRRSAVPVRPEGPAAPTDRPRSLECGNNSARYSTTCC